MILATQLPLFGDDATRPPAERRPARPRSRHVLHDPGVAAATAEHARLGCDLRTAFVSFWARLSPERRAELRGRLAA